MMAHHETRRIGRRWLVWVMTMTLAVSTGMRAYGQSSGAVGRLTLRDAVARALDREPDLRAERTEVDVARGMLAQAGLQPNPMVSVVQQQQPGGMDNQTNVTVEWPLDLFRKTGRVRLAEREVDGARLRVAERERLLVAQVREAYGKAAAAERDLEVFDDMAAAAARQFELVRGRVEDGAAPPIERDLLGVERRRIDADRLLRAAQADGTMMALKRLLGFVPTESMALQDTLESLVDASASPPPGAGETMLLQRADIREADARVRIAEAAIDRARRDGRVDVSLFGTYTRMQASFPQFGFTQGGVLQPVGDVFHYLAAGATVTVPWRNDNRGEIAAAEARRTGAETRREALELQVRTEVAIASIFDEQARDAVVVYARDIRPLARENVDVVRQTYELGRGTVADVLSEQRRYLDIERAYTDALKQAYDARTSLLSALGVQP